jgi:hypothetical protein
MIRDNVLLFYLLLHLLSFAHIVFILMALYSESQYSDV